jgi:hypothetical protein
MTAGRKRERGLVEGREEGLDPVEIPLNAIRITEEL